ncbi:MAG: hypothetical protein A2V67_06360 [Deltaproteobacteria bacterium RBG_13_61_14]|nr:MAG: hypothetical protein A2V67_06360 [Deltaproteobacteria bacterium RBG_13_61_14]
MSAASRFSGRIRLFSLFASCLLLPGFCGAVAVEPSAPAAITFESLLQDLSDLESLTRPATYSAGMISTWDRSGGNDDGETFLHVQGNTAILADLLGPGVITRIWSASPAGRVRVYLDGSPEPLVDLPALELFSGQVSPFLKPLVGHETGSYSYLPIPFARRCRIEIAAQNPAPGSQPDFGLFWQVSFRQYPPGTAVQSLTLPLSREAYAAWPPADRLGRAPTRGDSCQPEEVTLSTERQKEIEIVNYKGSGIFSGFQISAPEDYYLKVFWDQESSPSLEIPASWSRVPFPMPFARQALIHLACDGPCSADTVSIGFTVCRAERVSDYRLHGWYHQEWTRAFRGPNLSAEHNYRILRVQGRGLYVGTWLMVWNKYFIWWGEGDEMIFVDDESWPPAFHGTGTEDYFDGAWSEFGRSPFTGALVKDSLGKSHAGKTMAFRWHLADPIPFTRSLDFSIEHGQAANDLDNPYASLAFWYQAEPHGELPPLPAYAERVWDEKRLQQLVDQEWRKAILFKLGRGFRLAGLGLLALLALFPVILFGWKMLRRRPQRQN